MQSHTLTAALCAVLDLADAFHHIATHLSSRDCQSLRETCKLLRHHTAVVEGVTTINEASRYQDGLRHLPALRDLRLHKPSSIFHLHRLSSLRLSWVTIDQTPVLDLTPLSFVTSLRGLVLKSVQSHTGLGSLNSLSTLLLNRTAATPEVLQLHGLTRLTLCEGSQIGRLSELSQLVALNIRSSGGGEWSPAATAALAAAIPAGLPALRDLSCSQRRLPPLHSLAQLTALNIHCLGAQLSGDWQDLRPLTGLVKLGLDSHRGQSQLQSESVTALLLAGGSTNGMSFPDLTGCGRLQHIMLKFNPPNDSDKFLICAEQLPPTARTFWLVNGMGSRLFLSMQSAAVLRVQHMRDLWWQTDPATL